MSSYTDGKYQSVSIFSPNGQVNTLNHIQNATLLGNTVVDGGNDNLGIVIAWKGVTKSRNHSRTLQKPVRKIFKSDNLLFTFSGITNDGNQLLENIQNTRVRELVWKNRDNLDLQAFKIEAGWNSIMSGSRCRGVAGLLMSFLEKDGAPVMVDLENCTESECHKCTALQIMELQPTGNIRKVHATAIGSRAQSCKTILEGFEGITNLNNTSEEEILALLIRSIKNAHGEGIEEKEFLDNLEGYKITRSGIEAINLI